MSRAFVRESDVPQLPELPPPPPPLPPGARNWVTPAGAARLTQELQQRLQTDRPRLAAAAADDCDARRELQVLDQRIRYLQQSLRTAELVPPPPPDARAVVRFSASVTVREAGQATTCYRIVGIDEADLARNWISHVSPLARALLQTRCGDRITLPTPRGPRELHVLAIDYAD